MGDTDPDTLVPIYSCDLRSPVFSASPPDAWIRGVAVVGTMVMRPRRLMGMSRTTPIDWPQRVLDARQPRVTSGADRIEPAQGLWTDVPGGDTARQRQAHLPRG